MRFRATSWLLIFLGACAGPVRGEPPPAQSYSQAIQPLLTRYCVSCHGSEKQSAAIALHDKKFESVEADRVLWDSVLQRLMLHEMPPKGKPQPSAEERRTAVAWLKAELSKTNCQKPSDPGRVTLRRLNRAEYNNTIRDLLALDFQPAEDFPSDDVGYGFDNIADVLALSPLLLEKYLTAAESITERAFQGQLPPLPPKREVRAREFRGTATFSPTPERLMKMTGGELKLEHEFPRDGEYLILYRALGVPIEREAVRLSLKIDGVEQHKSNLKPYAPGRFPDDREITLRVPAGKHVLSISTIEPEPKPKDKDQAATKEVENKRQAMVLGNLEIRGPLVPMVKAMPEAYRRIMVASPGGVLSKQDCAKRIVENFARKAYRRPPTADEVGRLVRLVEKAWERGDDFDHGIQLAVQAMLVSPHFLFKVENDPKSGQQPHPISDHELATRLSYFLWSSCPDEELSRVADSGQLRAQLVDQVRRMLRDPKVRALADNFAGQWLQIRNLKAAAPDAKLFPQFDESLRSAMMQETTLFFESMVRDDRNLLDFLDADFTFLNERLAKHYGIPDVKGGQFRRVSLQGTKRAGILTHGSVLTVTSNVTRTSPVKRGKFILESVFNTEPPPPPPDVPELSETPEAAASASLRQRLELHRSKSECAVCHQKMDPLGIAFENFDAIGSWRTKDGAFKIDPSGELPDGRRFDGAAELRAILRQNSDAFRRCLAEKLLIYGLGRGLAPTDRCAVDRICDRTKQKQDKISELIFAIVDSEPFQYRNPPTQADSR